MTTIWITDKFKMRIFCWNDDVPSSEAKRKGIAMARTTALGGISMKCWLAVFACSLPLIGCGGATRYPGILPAENESRTQASLSDSSSALRVARATRLAGDLSASIQLYRTLVANHPAADDIAVEFGDVLVDAGSPDDAIDVYSRIGARSPVRLDALIGTARAYLNLGEPDKALEYLNQAQSLGPRDARVLVDKGVALDTLNRHAEAQQLYKDVLSVTPRHISARNNLALSLALTGQYDAAIALIAPLVRSSAATPRERENMAIIYALMGDADRATLLSRVDLDEGTTKANLTFLAAVRGAKP